MRILPGAESQTSIDDETAIPTELYGCLLSAAERARQRGQHQLSASGNHLRLYCPRRDSMGAALSSRHSLRVEKRMLKREIQRLEADLARRELLGLREDIAQLTQIVAAQLGASPTRAGTEDRTWSASAAEAATEHSTPRSWGCTPNSSPGSGPAKSRQLSLDSNTTAPAWEPVLLNISYKTQDGSSFSRHSQRESDRAQECCPKFCSTLFGRRGKQRKECLAAPPPLMSCDAH